MSEKAKELDGLPDDLPGAEYTYEIDRQAVASMFPDFDELVSGNPWSIAPADTA